MDKVLYVAMRYDYGRKDQGASFEFNNFYRTLTHMVPRIVEFDFMTLLQENGRPEMNRMLLAIAEREQPDLIFFVLFTDEILPETIRELTKRHTTFNWFCDDHWRFSNYSRHYAPMFSFVSTTDASAVMKYRDIGYRNVIRTQWACNHFDYRRKEGIGRTREISFVGQPHGSRRRLVESLRRSGIAIDAFGQGWPNGRISQDRMIDVFNESKINLNLSNSSWNIHTLFRGRQQIKGRNFEVPGCGGFLLTNHVAGLEEYYRPGEEVVCFTSKGDLSDKIRYYLLHNGEREEIARRGHERTLREHTYEQRFTAIFRAMGLTA